MADAFELVDAQAGHRFLKGLPPATRRKGEALFRNGRVQDLAQEEPGMTFTSLVQDGGEQEVYLHYDPEDGWDGNCTCEEEFDCAHVFAAMSTLLAEHRAALVRSLSAGLPAMANAWSGPKRESGTAQDLKGRLMAATGRALTKDETKFLDRVHQVYLRCRQNRQISYWDFQELGLPIFDGTWGALQIWPSFPATEHEFWLYVANALQERGLRIPEVMRPITDLGVIQEPLARWRRAREVQKWQQALANLQTYSARAQPASAAAVDLRVVIDERSARLDWLRPGQTTFEPLKQAHFRQLAAEYEQGGLALTPEAELVWHFFSDFLPFRMKIDFRAPDEEMTEALGRLLRLRVLDSRVVNRVGQPFPRIAEPLRWEVTPAANEEDDYRVRLVQADGRPLPPILCVLPGCPALYLSDQGIFAGPAAQESVLEATAENRIPAPVIEQANGVAFLQSLGVELPQRLRERVRTLPFEVVITCALRPSFPGSEVEECAVHVTAEAPDGRQQFYSGCDWTEKPRRAGRREGQREMWITVYDTARLREVPPLLAPLNLKPAMYGGGLALRVTKKFPELFAAWLKTVPQQITVQLQGELASFMSTDVAGRVQLEVTEAEIDWFDLRVALEVADTTLTAEEIKLLLNAKGGYVRLRGKGWRRLQFDLSEEENERLARLGLSPREMTAEPQRLHALQLADEAAKKFLPAQQVDQIQRRAGEITARVAPDVPAEVTAQLRPYQVEGFHFLAYLATNRFGGILADDMGLGKTLQTLAWLVWLRGQRNGERAAEGSETGKMPVLPSLVVCPKSVMDNWQAEAARFTPGLRVRVWSPSEIGEFGGQLGSADLHVLNYTQLRSLGERLVQVRWQTVILDEGQYIKNPNSQTAQVARALRADQRLVLSGTPIENRLLDLWSLMCFAMPGVLSSRAQFARLYDAKGDPFARRRLAARVRPFVLRRTKGQVAKDLPDRIEEDLFCEVEGEQKTLYRAELKRAQQLLLGIKTQKELAQQQFHFLTSLLRLRQICCHPRLMKPDSTAPSAKAESLLEQLEPLMEEGQKVLVFSQFVEMLDLLRPALEERQWRIFYLAGQTENRGELVREFQSAEGPAIFLISLKAGGFGLNLTAASYVVLFDPWWNPAVENQAIDRTHRIGQVNKVIAYRLLIKNSIEEKIRELQKHKKALAEDVLGEEKFAQSLTLADLQFLFAD
jgi:hypothetical protein